MLGDNRSACWLIWNFHNIHKWCGHKPIIRDREPACLMCDNVHQGKLHPQSLSTLLLPFTIRKLMDRGKLNSLHFSEIADYREIFFCGSFYDPVSYSKQYEVEI